MTRKLLLKPLVPSRGLTVVLGFIVIAIFAPYIAPESARHTDFATLLAHPSRHHLLGTDALGRDVFSRLVRGARASLEVAVFSTVLALLVAVPLGLVGGYFTAGRRHVVARATVVLLAFPFPRDWPRSESSGRRSGRQRSRSAWPAPAFFGSPRSATLALPARGTSSSQPPEAVGASDARIAPRHAAEPVRPLLTQTTIMIPRRGSLR